MASVVTSPYQRRHEAVVTTVCATVGAQGSKAAPLLCAQKVL